MPVVQDAALFAASLYGPADRNAAWHHLGCIRTIDSCIARAVAAKSMEDERLRRSNWALVERSETAFAASGGEAVGSSKVDG
jgi:hypothetical protein